MSQRAKPRQDLCPAHTAGQPLPQMNTRDELPGGRQGMCWCHPRGIPGWIRVPSLRSEGAALGPRQGGHSRWFWEGFQSWVCLDLVFINCGPALAVPKCPIPGTLHGAVPMGDVGWENIEDGDGAGPSFLKHLHTPNPFIPISFALQLLEDGFL